MGDRFVRPGMDQILAKLQYREITHIYSPGLRIQSTLSLHHLLVRNNATMPPAILQLTIIFNLILVR